MRKLQKSILLATTALSLAAPAAVRAADSVVAAGQGQIEQIVVTARRKEERLQDVPISITVFNQQQLSNHNVVNAMDLAKYTPSLSTNTEFGSEQTTFALRGFSQDIGTAPAVGVFFADVIEPRGPTQGITAGDGAGPGDFFDLQNVQVLKGPQGTLFGRNTTGGDILIVPQKPTDEFGGYVQGSFGNYNLRGGQGVINIPVTDQIRLRFGIDHESRDGYLNNTSGIGPKDFDDVNYTALRGSADIDITPDLEDYIIASYSNSDTNGDFQKQIVCDQNAELLGAAGGGPFLFTAFGGACNQNTPGNKYYQGGGFYDGAQGLPQAYAKLVQWRVINTTTWRESDNLTIKNIASYAQLNLNESNALFGSNFHTTTSFTTTIPNTSTIITEPTGLPRYPIFFAAVAPAPGVPYADQATYTEELQVQGNNFDNRLTWQGGGYMSGDVPLSPGGAQSPITADCINVATLQCYDPLGRIFAGFGEPEHIAAVDYTVGTTNDSDYALYGQGTYKLLDVLKLTGGFRYTWDRLSNTSNQITYYPGYPISLTGAPLPPSVVGKNCTYPADPGYISPNVNPLGYGTASIPPGACILHTKELSNAPTWLLDLDYTPTEDVLLYVKWSRGYRQGIITPNVPAPYDIAGPEKVDSYEGGFKTSFDWNGIAGTFDAAGFYNDFRNQQLLLGLVPSPCYIEVIPGDPASCEKAPIQPTESIINAGKSRIAGMELDTTIVPYDGVTLQLGYTYLNTDILAIKQFPPIAGALYVPSGTQKSGDVLPLAPKNKLSFTASYVLPVDESWGKITLSTTFTHTDEQLTNYTDALAAMPVSQGGLGPNGAVFVPLSNIQATNLLDLNLNWEQVYGHPFDLSVFATNVTGDKYYTYIPGLAGSIGAEDAQVGQPTFYGVRIKIHFGED